jgi:hypothetical protein
MGYSATTENSTTSDTSVVQTSTSSATPESIVKPFSAGSKENTPLEDLVRSALTRAGNFSPSRIDGEVMMMMIELANRIVEEIRRNPYWTGGDIDYYNDPTECRPIPDMIMIDGLTAHYLIQQGSDKAMVFLQMYQANLTDTLHNRTHGNKGYAVNIKDGGSNKRYK